MAAVFGSGTGWPFDRAVERRPNDECNCAAKRHIELQTDCHLLLAWRRRG
jgi:hypothetical protein